MRPNVDSFPVPDELRVYARAAQVEGGLRLHYYEAGAVGAPPLVLVHGLGDEADTWRHVIEPLATRYRVIAPDLPGFGRSDRPRRSYTLVFFARAVAGLLRHLQIESATLVGNSLGAAVVQRLALARPSAVERLVLVDGALPISRAGVPYQLLLMLTPGLGEATYTSLRTSQDAAYNTLRPYYRDLDALPEHDRAFLRERVWARVWSDGQRRAFLSALRWLMIERTLRADEHRERVAWLDVPTRLIWGDSDQIAPVAAAREMVELLPHAQLTVLRDCGHLPQQERPADFLALL